MIITGITRLANGMNHDPIDQPGVKRAPWRSRASLFFAARNIQMMNSTTIRSWVSP